MVVRERFVLPPDVVIAPVATLPLELRERVAHDEGDCAITRPRSRLTSSIVDAKTASLLESFRTPATIVDAVIAFSAAEQLDPASTLDETFPVISGFVNDGLLVSADSELAGPIATSLEPGDRVGGFEVVEPVHLMVDTEVYLARRPDGSFAALKLAREGVGPQAAAAFAREATMLRWLDGSVSPRLLDVAEHGGRPYLATSWRTAADVYQAARELHTLGGNDGRAALLKLAEAVVAAYARLHAQSVLHGDVHPSNVLVDAVGQVTIVDFALAAPSAPTDAVAMGRRGGIDFFLEPELAATMLAGHPGAPLSAVGEQYSLASLLYLLLTGSHTHAFSLEREEMLRQLVEQPPLPFARHDVRGLVAVEEVLRRALAKDPAERYASVADLGRALRAAADHDRTGTPDEKRHGRAAAEGRQLLAEVIDRLAVPGELAGGELAAPTASVMNGGAGFAYALLRIAGSRDDEGLLALADLWSTRSQLALGSEQALWSPQLEIVPDTFGEVSLFHTEPGVHCVQALVAVGRGDESTATLARDAFVAAASRPCEHADVTFGRAGLLLGCALLLDALPPDDGGGLHALGERLRDSLWSQLEGQAPLDDRPELRSLGAAHGWAGFLFALLRWSEASKAPPPAGVEDRLLQLGAQGLPSNRGMRWPHEAGAGVQRSGLEASWCNGAAGQVPLWALAHRLYRDDRFARWVEMAGWTVYDDRSVAADLCCGFAGRAYALLGVHRLTGDPAWLARARMLADRAVEGIRTNALRRDSLYKGEVGVALLVAELERPEHSCMPLFEGER